MRILVVSTFGLWGMPQHISSALVKMGHEVEVFYANSGGSLAQRALNWLKYVKVYRDRAYKLWQIKVNRRLIHLARAFHPELLFVVKGDELFSWVLEAIKKEHKAILLNWLADNPFYLKLENILQAIPVYDYIFTFDPAHLPKLNKLTNSKVIFLPLACQPQAHRRIILSQAEYKKYECDICFIGTALPNRIEIIKNLRDYNLAVWGRGWQRQKGWLGKHYRGEASGEKMVKVYNASKIALNIHAPQTIDGLNLRTFEICASSAFQLTDMRQSLPDLFRIGQEIAVYSDFAQLKESVDYFLAHKEKREAVAMGGYQRAHQEHTYLERLKEIFSFISR
jgi:spore maturation protein CgeB